MTRDDLTTPVTAAATTQVKLCPYNEEEPHIWFRLIEAQFAAAGIRSQNLQYANVLAPLPKQVLLDILDTLNVYNESDEPFNYLKNTLLGQFRKSKWQSYFVLLCVPIDMQGLKPSVLMGKLKQHLPPVVSPDNDLFLAMFLVRQPPSICETVGAGNRSRGHGEGRMPCGMLEAATTLQPRPPRLSEVGALLPTAGGEATNRGVTPALKVTPSPAQISISFRTLAMVCANFIITTPTGLTGVFHPVLGRKTSLLLNYFRFGGQSSTRHCHGDAFPSQCRTHFPHG
jgi:hypothetical protein